MRRLSVLIGLVLVTGSIVTKSPAQNPSPTDPDERESKLIPIERSPEARTKAVRVTKIADLPRTYWASRLKPGEVAIVDGIISIRDGGQEDQRILIPGVPMSEQPTFDLEPIEADTTAATARRILEQTRQFADWAATFYGKGLPRVDQQKLRSLYRSMADSGALLANPRSPSLQAPIPSATRLALAGFLSRALIRERSIFDPYPAARDQRYTRLRPRVQAVDTTRLREALDLWMNHDTVQPGAQHIRPFPPGQGPFQGGYFPDFKRLQPSSSGPVDLSLYVIKCSGDTVIETHVIESVPLNWAEARVVVAIHPVFGTLRDILEFFGVDNDWLYHSSIGGAVWEAFADRRVRSSYLVSKCELKSSDSVFKSPLPWQKKLIRADSSTEYRLSADHWSYANGASGTYPTTYSGHDELIVVKRKVFETGNAYSKAVRWLHTPTPASNGVYHRIRAVSYSVGDYGENWICQVTLNAFAVRRYRFAPIGEPSGELIYGLYGNRGISARSWYSRIIKGCVPGKACFYNRPPVAKGTLEHWLAGKGYNLDKFWSPRLDSWYNSDADYTGDQPEWPHSSERVESVPGWP
jgi:hypothetical protein